MTSCIDRIKKHETQNGVKGRHKNTTETLSVESIPNRVSNAFSDIFEENKSVPPFANQIGKNIIVLEAIQRNQSVNDKNGLMEKDANMPVETCHSNKGE